MDLYVLLRDSLLATAGTAFKLLGLGWLFCWGTTVPTDGTAGYAKGCLFIDLDGATNDVFVYVNKGTGTICQFVPLADVTYALAKTVSGIWTFNETLKTASGVGALPSVTGLAVAEYGDGVVHKTVLTFTDVDFALTDVAGVVAYVGKKVYDFPEGFIKLLGAVANLSLTKSSAGVNADWDGDFALGSTTAGNNNALATTEQDMIPTTATPQAAAGATTAKGVSTAAEEVLFDGHTTALDAFLNFLVDDADQDVTGTACNLIVNGTVTLHWMNKGDY